MLLGDDRLQIGVGIIFYKSDEWRMLCERLTGDGRDRAMDPIARERFPIPVEVSRDGKLKIVDFGVAKHFKAGEKQQDAKIVGSPLYLSPETIRNEKVDHCSDIYSLGATFYHLIAGTPPFIDISMRNILAKHLNDPIPPLKAKAPDTPACLCDIVEKMMSKEVARRFQGYGEIIECLDRQGCGSGVIRAWPWAKGRCAAK